MSTVPPVPAPQPPALSLPATLAAGDFLSFSVLTALPAGCTVTYWMTALVQDAALRIELGPVAVDASGVASFPVASATTAGWTPGRYQWVCYAYDPQFNRTNLASGQMLVTPDPAGATPIFPPSANELLLRNIRCLLEGRSLEDAQMYKIGSRELTKMPHKELLQWEGIVEARVRRERRRRAGRDNAPTVAITFGGSGTGWC